MPNYEEIEKMVETVDKYPQHVSKEELMRIFKESNDNDSIIWAFCMNQYTPFEILEYYCSLDFCNKPIVQNRESKQGHILFNLYGLPDGGNPEKVFYKNITKKQKFQLIRLLSDSPYKTIRLIIAKNKQTPTVILDKLIVDKLDTVQNYAFCNKKTSLLSKLQFLQRNPDFITSDLHKFVELCRYTMADIKEQVSEVQYREFIEILKAIGYDNLDNL